MKTIAPGSRDEQQTTSAKPASEVLRCYLLPHVYACETDEGIVFLNTRTDQYRSINKANSLFVSRALAGLSSEATVAEDGSRTEKWVQFLESSGLVTRDPEKGKVLCPASLSEVDIERSYDIRFSRPGITLGDVACFSTALVKAALAILLAWLRIYSLDRTLLRLQHARTRISRTHGVREDVVAAIAAKFLLMRRFVVSSRDRCLFYSLARVYFMRRYDVHPQLVLGARITPFWPHSWTQLGRLAFDDRPERLGLYTPICAI